MPGARGEDTTDGLRLTDTYGVDTSTYGVDDFRDPQDHPTAAKPVAARTRCPDPPPGPAARTHYAGTP